MEIINPLNETDLEALNRVLSSTEVTAEFLQRCVKCGLTVADVIKKNAAQSEQARKVKEQFFPEAP